VAVLGGEFAVPQQQQQQMDSFVSVPRFHSRLPAANANECSACIIFAAAGHAYYFLEDVYPRMTGRRPLKTPSFIQAMFPVDEPIRPAADVVMHQFAADELQQQQANGMAQQGQEQLQQQAVPAAGVEERAGDGRPHAD
jgi:hypothetical protein